MLWGERVSVNSFLGNRRKKGFSSLSSYAFRDRSKAKNDNNMSGALLLRPPSFERCFSPSGVISPSLVAKLIFRWLILEVRVLENTDFKIKLSMDIMETSLIAVARKLVCSSGTVMSYFWMFIGVTFNMNNVWIRIYDVESWNILSDDVAQKWNDFTKTTAPILYVQIQKLLVDVATTPDSTKRLSLFTAIPKYVFRPFPSQARYYNIEDKIRYNYSN